MADRKPKAPLVPPETDLRTLGYMPLRVNDLRDSDFAAIANDAEFRAGVMLWCAAWHQLPAASLPDDDRLLCRLAGLGRDMDAFLAVKTVALHGFIGCSDGRLYHPVIADLALLAAKKQRRDVERTRNATEARRARNGHRNVERDDIVDDDQSATLRPPREREIIRDRDRDREKEVVAAQDAASKSKGTRLPDDFEPDASCQALAEKLLLTRAQSQLEFDKFRDYWKAKPGKDGRKLDWQATFKNWLRNVKGTPTNGKVKAGSIADNFATINARFDAAERELAESENGLHEGGEDFEALPGLFKNHA